MAAPELGPPAEPPPAMVETGRIGDKLTISDRSGKAQLEITVTRLKFSTGDGVDQPGHVSIWVCMWRPARWPTSSTLLSRR